MTDPNRPYVSRVVVAIIGSDQPGVVARSAQVLTACHCNICEMTQQALRGQFACILLVDKPEGLSNEAIASGLTEAFKANGLHLSVVTRDYVNPVWEKQDAQPFVMSIWGPDRNDIITEFSAMCAAKGANIEGLRAFPIELGQSLQVIEVAVPAEVDLPAWHKELLAKAESMGLKLSMQHEHIFEAIHRVRTE